MYETVGTSDDCSGKQGVGNKGPLTKVVLLARDLKVPTAKEGEEHQTGGIVWLKYADVDGAPQGFLASASVSEHGMLAETLWVARPIAMVAGLTPHCRGGNFTRTAATEPVRSLA